MSVERNFDADKTADDLVKWINHMFKDNPESKAIIGISGGKDSTVAALLCTLALGKDRVVGIMMPNGSQHDINDSKYVVNALGIENHEMNIKNSYDAVMSNISAVGEVSKQTEINVAPRLRMTTLYAYAQSHNGLVINTTNLSERYVGYGTKWGDVCGDFSPFANLTKSEVVEIGKSLCKNHFKDFNMELIIKVPSDGLSGKSDEESFGVTYDEIDKVIRHGAIYGMVSEESMKKIVSMNSRASTLDKVMCSKQFFS